MSQFRIGTKLLVAFALVIAFFIANFLYGISQYDAVTHDYRTGLTRSAPLEIALERADADLWRFLGSSDGQTQLAARQDLLAQLQIVQADATTPAEKSQAATLVQDFQNLFNSGLFSASGVGKADADLQHFLAFEANANRQVLSRDQAQTRFSRLVQELLLVAAVILAVVVALGITRAIARPLANVTELARKMAEGDLTGQEVVAQGRDEVAELTRSFNAMRSALREMIGQIRETSRRVAVASEELTASAEQTAEAVQQVAQAVTEMAAGADDQARGAGTMSHSMDDLKSAIRQVAEGSQSQLRALGNMQQVLQEMARAVSQVGQHARDVYSAANRTLELAHGGHAAVERTVDGMDRIRTSVEEAAAKVRELGDHSQRVGEITGLISGIAEQTNLLALNAAIEAARAGEQGKGFAVVADAVRSLAQQASEAAKTIADLVTTIQRGTGDVVASMEAGTEEVRAGSRLAHEAGEALAAIVEAMGETHRRVEDINQATEAIQQASRTAVEAAEAIHAISQGNAAASEQMTASSDQVGEAISQVAATAQQTAATTEEVSAAAEEMSASTQEIARASEGLVQVARELQALTERFRVAAGNDGVTVRIDSAQDRKRVVVDAERAVGG